MGTYKKAFDYKGIIKFLMRGASYREISKKFNISVGQISAYNKKVSKICDELKGIENLDYNAIFNVCDSDLYRNEIAAALSSTPLQCKAEMVEYASHLVLKNFDVDTVKKLLFDRLVYFNDTSKDRVSIGLKQLKDNADDLEKKYKDASKQPLAQELIPTSGNQARVFDKFNNQIKTYDDVLDVVSSTNVRMAKTLSALISKVMIRANELLDERDLSPKDMSFVVSCLHKANDIMQVIPKTQPLIAQQFNINNQELKRQTPQQAVDDYSININFIGNDDE